ncbi:hypothetical protein CA54_12280 [Symmachiella macrocystis]|uniref:DUF3365 domain-containing protein n=1 Tax=Symmachiella macrocystis TaxID=2527985 RepID=A0A5C6BP89_9PLAN|nr:hypothetical protein [Symmachiella macrocystis]TWU12404.1 hypothetical protein CA54_12280 [Symmachiella macrocystis]
MTPVLASIPVGLCWALICSALLLAFCIASARIHWAGAAFGYLLFGGLVTLFWFFAFTMSPVLLWNWALLLLVTIVAASMKWSVQRTLVCGLTATAAAYLITAVAFIPEYQERLALREEYPQVSLVERLAYENRPETSKESDATGNEDPRTGYSSLYLDEVESKLGNEDRLWSDDVFARRKRSLPSLYRPALNDAHKGFVHEFITADGAGVMRMPRRPARREFIEIPETKPIPIPKPSPQAEPTPEQFVREDKMAPDTPLDKMYLDQFHLDGMADFADAIGFGYVEESWNYNEHKLEHHLDRVTGFQPHAFRKFPEPLTNSDKSVRWLIEKLELVSLLKHDTPRVYESKNLPRMDELSTAPTRPLDEFETAALARLRAGETLVVHQDHNDIRMLGPIVAINQCLECHNVSRGDLLGAFTYRLVRDPQLPALEGKAVSWLVR